MPLHLPSCVALGHVSIGMESKMFRCNDNPREPSGLMSGTCTSRLHLLRRLCVICEEVSAFFGDRHTS